METVNIDRVQTFIHTHNKLHTHMHHTITTTTTYTHASQNNNNNNNLHTCITLHTHLCNTAEGERFGGGGKVAASGELDGSGDGSTGRGLCPGRCHAHRQLQRRGEIKHPRATTDGRLGRRGTELLADISLLLLKEVT